jgi:FkbM family methyltransferase
MNIRRYIKNWLSAHPGAYHFYTRIRYGSRTEVRDWVMDTHKFMREKELNTFVFESESVYVRLDGGHEFKYVPELMGGLLGLEFKRGFESEDLRSALRLLPVDAIVIDVGANFGIYSVLVASTFASTQVHAFEPVSRTADLLRANAERNGVLSRICINNVALGSETGNLLITSDRYAGNYLLSEGDYDGNTQEVPVIRLDDYVAQKGLQRVDFIKCDVEGAELLVMKGAEGVLAKMRPIVMLEIAGEWTNRFGYSPDVLINYMRDAGYDCKHSFEVSAGLGYVKPSVLHTHNYFFYPKPQ